MSKSKGENALLRTHIIDLPGGLDGLVSAFASLNQQSDEVQLEEVESVFSGLAFCKGYEGSTAHICKRILNEKRVLEGLVKCLYEHKKPGWQRAPTSAITNLAWSSNDTLNLRVANQDGALEGLVTLLSAHDKPSVQEDATYAIANLASSSNDTLELQVANQDRALEGLVTMLSAHDKPDVQEEAARALAGLPDTGDNARNFEEGKALLRVTDGLLEGLSSLLENSVLPDVQYWGASALTFINPTLGKGASLTSGEAYKGRAFAFIRMGMYVEALADLDQAIHLHLLTGTDGESSLSNRSFVKAKLEDFEGALDDANEAVKVSSSDQKSFPLQERGVLKRIMGELEGALADLDEGLKLKTDYERLKHRGYVKFLLKDEEGACADAEWALRIKYPSVDRYSYGLQPCLGVATVEYSSYKLK